MFFEHKGVDVNFESDKAASVSVYRLFGADHDASAWPRRTSVLCWHCCHPFDTIPVSFATSIRQREKGVEWTMKGVYCSVECCRRHLCESAAYNTPTLLMRLYDFAEKVLGIDRPEDTQVAPPREALRAFGGTLTIEEFRQSFTTPQTCGLLSYPFVSYPMLMSMGGSGSSGLADALGHDSSSSIRRLTRPSAPAAPAKREPRAPSAPAGSAATPPPTTAEAPVVDAKIPDNKATETEEVDSESVYDMYIKRRISGSGPSLAEALPAADPPGKRKSARKTRRKPPTKPKKPRPKKPKPKKEPKPKKQNKRRAKPPENPKTTSCPRPARSPARPHRPATGTVKCRVLRSSARAKDSASEPVTRTLGKRRPGSEKGGPNTLMCYVVSD